MTPETAGCERAILAVRPPGGRAVARTSYRLLAGGVVVERAGQGPLPPVVVVGRSDAAGFGWR
jgi:hypothetical protein